MIEIPDTWKAALAAVQTVYPDAVMAGGCLRDLDNGREVKDIDIFVRGNSMRQLELLERRLRDDVIGFDHVEEINNEHLYPVGDGNDVVGHFDAKFCGFGTPIQIIMVDWPTDNIVERFDYGICRLAFNGETLVRPPEYDEDKGAEVFKLRRRREGVELVASVHRFARLTRKYEGWSFALFEPEDGIPFL